jgi:hypothetical protein
VLSILTTLRLGANAFLKMFNLRCSPFVFVACAAIPAFADSLSTAPFADAFVATGPTGNLSNNNYGGGGALALAAPGLTNGEFQTVLRFDFSGMKAQFDARFGLDQWSIGSISLLLVSSPHNNAIYNDIAPGTFGISLMQNSSWVEGTGNASNPSSNGITYNTLVNSFINNSSDPPLGVFSFSGGASGTNVYTLPTSAGLDSDIYAGSIATLRLYGADNQVSYLFSSRSSTSGSPLLVVTATPEPMMLAFAPLVLAVLRLRTSGRTRKI